MKDITDNSFSVMISTILRYLQEHFRESVIIE